MFNFSVAQNLTILETTKHIGLESQKVETILERLLEVIQLL